LDTITSRNNPKVKQARALRERKGRAAADAFLVEGIRHVGEALEAGAAVETVFFAPDFLHSGYARGLIAELAAQGVSCYPTTGEVFQSLADKENPQGILAIVRQRKASLALLNPDNFSWAVALVTPQDPGNVGTILRTIDAAGASGLILLEGGVDPYHPNAVRASLGTLFWHPVVMTTFAEFMDWARAHRYHIYGTSARSGVDFRSRLAFERPRILLMGSEREGLTPEQTAACEQMVRLPMRGRATSLNLAVATSVLLYAMIED
jgi:TrmH family RNA methyltransferase